MDPVTDTVNEEGGASRLPRAERLLVSLAVVCLFVMGVLITVNVVSRWLGRSIVPDDVLLVQELMVPVILLPIGVVTALRAHIAVELFTSRLHGRGAAALAILAHLVGIAFGLFLFWAALRSFLDSWETQDYYNGILHIRMWPGQGIFVFAIGLFLFRLLVLLATDTRRLLRGGSAGMKP